MESRLIELSKYRYERAVESLKDAELLCIEMRYSSAVNRAYYAIFHALRAVTALDGFDSGKHSGVIAYFNRNYVKNGIFNKKISKNIDMSFRLREKADYQDFVMISREMAEEQINKAKEVLLEIKPYVVSIWEKEE